LRSTRTNCAASSTCAAALECSRDDARSLPFR
jgi:hypothetical protein